MDDKNLITLIRSFDCLYDKNNAHFKNVGKRDEIWTTIAQQLGVSVDMCQSRWRLLREKYAREKRNERAIAADETVSRLKWIYMDQLAFLEPHIHPRKPSTMVYDEPQQSREDLLCPIMPLEVYVAKQLDVASCSNSPSTSTDLQSREEFSDFEEQKDSLDDLSEEQFAVQLADQGNLANQMSDYGLDECSSSSSKSFKEETKWPQDDEVQRAVVTSAKDEESEMANDEDVQFVSSLLCMFRRMKRRKKALCKAEIFRVLAQYESEEEDE